MKPVVTAALALAGAFVAYEVWGRSPADKAKVGDVVCVPLSVISPDVLNLVRPGLAGMPFSEGSLAYLRVTEVQDAVKMLRGQLTHVVLPSTGTLVFRRQNLSTSCPRSSILSRGLPAHLPAPVTTL